MNILYYSNHCPYSKKIINKLSKSIIKDEFNYISLDNRILKNDSIFVKLRNGDEFEIEKTIDKVPALSLQSYGNRVIFGNEIIDFISIKEKETDNNNDLEPSPFSFYGGCDNVVSDFYSYLDTPIQEFSASDGNAGMTQIYSYATIDYNTYMNTPPDTYTPDKIGTNENLLETILENRNKDVPLPTPRS